MSSSKKTSKKTTTAKKTTAKKTTDKKAPKKTMSPERAEALKVRKAEAKERKAKIRTLTAERSDLLEAMANVAMSDEVSVEDIVAQGAETRVRVLEIHTEIAGLEKALPAGWERNDDGSSEMRKDLADDTLFLATITRDGNVFSLAIVHGDGKSGITYGTVNHPDASVLRKISTGIAKSVTKKIKK